MLAAAQNDEGLIQDFNETGLIVIDLAGQDVQAVIDRVVEGLSPAYGHSHRIENAWRILDDVRHLANLPQVHNLLKKIYGRRPFPFQTLNFNRGTEQAPHSDSVHFDSRPQGYMAGVWIALEDIDESNGPLRYYPGSHRLPQLTLADFGVTDFGGRSSMELYREIYEPGIASVIRDHGLKPRDAHLRKGQALIWAANLLHAGSPILDLRRSRHSQVTHYYFDGCSYHTPLLTGSGRPKRRYPVDITSGRNVGGVEDGKPIPVPIRQRLQSWGKSWLKSGTIKLY